jgi:hypothetical protein
LAGAAYAALRPIDWLRIARLVDDRYECQDRIATAWFFSREPELHGFKRLQVLDALDHLRHLELARVAPWQTPRSLWYALGMWATVMIVSTWLSQPATVLARATVAQARQDAVNEQVAAELEATLLNELRRLAERTGTRPPDSQRLRELSEDVRRQLETLKRPGTTQEESLATLSQIQTTLERASAQFDTSPVDAQLHELGQVLAAADELAATAEALQDRNYEQAAQSLEALDPRPLDAQERQTVAAELQPLVAQLQQQQQPEWADAVQPLQQGLEQNDPAQTSAAAKQLGAKLRQQALRLAVQTALELQIAQLADAKGLSRSGGNNTDRSDRPSETWGRGKAGEPLADAMSPLDTQRQRHELTGMKGEGPAERQTTQADKAPGTATREYQAAFDEYQRAAEEVLRQESLPIGHRQTIRRYFESIRPE